MRQLRDVHHPVHLIIWVFLSAAALFGTYKLPYPLGWLPALAVIIAASGLAYYTHYHANQAYGAGALPAAILIGLLIAATAAHPPNLAVTIVRTIAVVTACWYLACWRLTYPQLSRHKNAPPVAALRPTVTRTIVCPQCSNVMHIDASATLIRCDRCLISLA